ncbi:MAG: hypothetical protein K2Q09_08070, partial [Phycisphaerales bacterium]|nr:hypothetical protein [Phycisphaerales bacterium]
MTPLTTSNFPPNEGSFDLPPTRLDELLADRATAGLSDAEEIELTRLLTAAGTTDDISIDLAAAAVACASVPEARSIALPDSLVHALDREAEAWCAGVGSHRVEPARVHGSSLRSEVGRGHALRTP